MRSRPLCFFEVGRSTGVLPVWVELPRIFNLLHFAGRGRHGARKPNYRVASRIVSGCPCCTLLWRRLYEK
jgi:hypothetical protein